MQTHSRGYENIQYFLWVRPDVKEGSNTSTVALRVVGGDEKETKCMGV
jgi:hypothetical protein